MSHRVGPTDHYCNNWATAGVCLKYVTEAIAGYASRLSQIFHCFLIDTISQETGTVPQCAECTLDKLLPLHKSNNCLYQPAARCLCSNPRNRRTCPNNAVCSLMYELLIRHHKSSNPVWSNTDPSRWVSDYWSVAKCYVSTHADDVAKSRCAADVDITCLLSILNNNLYINNLIKDKDAFQKVRDARNKIMHSPSNEMTDDELSEFIDLLIDVLKSKDLDGDAVARHSLEQLTLIKNGIVTENDEKEIKEKVLETIHREKENALSALREMEKHALGRINMHTDRTLQYLQRKVKSAGKTTEHEDELELGSSGLKVTIEEVKSCKSHQTERKEVKSSKSHQTGRKYVSNTGLKDAYKGPMKSRSSSPESNNHVRSEKFESSSITDRHVSNETATRTTVRSLDRNGGCKIVNLGKLSIQGGTNTFNITHNY